MKIMEETDKIKKSKFVQTRTAQNLNAVTLKRDPYEINKRLKGERYVKYRELWKQAYDFQYEPFFPLQLDIDLVNDCNRRCVMCLQWKDPGFDGHRMPMDLLRDVLTEAKTQGCKAINLGDCSEPLFNKHLFLYAMKLMKELDFEDSFIHTNAIPLNNRIMSSILDSGIGTFSVSLGMMEDPAVLAFQLEQIRRFNEYRGDSELPIFRVCMLPNSENIEQKEYVVKELEGVVDYIEMQGLFDCTDIVSRYTGFHKYGYKCADTWRRLYVDTYGRLYQCCQFPSINPHLYLGNYREIEQQSTSRQRESLAYVPPIAKAWNSKEAKANRIGLRDGTLQKCVECIDRYYMWGENK